MFVFQWLDISQLIYYYVYPNVIVIGRMNIVRKQSRMYVHISILFVIVIIIASIERERESERASEREGGGVEGGTSYLLLHFKIFHQWNM